MTQQQKLNNNASISMEDMENNEWEGGCRIQTQGEQRQRLTSFKPVTSTYLNTHDTSRYPMRHSLPDKYILND